MSKELLNPIVGQNGSASVVYFYYGDSPFLTLGQETLRLKKAFKNYDRVVLLKHNDVVAGPFDFTEGDERNADVTVTPTKANLSAQLADLTARGYLIDLYIFSHGDTGRFVASTGQHGSSVNVTGDDIRQLPKAAGVPELPIRMIWSTLCFGESLNDDWTAIGAKVVSGSRFVNFYPTQFRGFIDAWNDGDRYTTALADSDTASSRALAQTYIGLGHAVRHRGDWGGCPVGRTVLGDSPCAKKYFAHYWRAGSEFTSGMSGREYMNLASKRFTAGDGNIRKTTVPTWARASLVPSLP